MPGHMCVEAAIMFAKGLSHGDTPPCVAEPDREYAICINDAPWSSPKARADALLPLALAQLDTAGTDRREWIRYLVLHVVRRMLPLVLRNNPALAVRCEEAADLEEALSVSAAASDTVPYPYVAASYAADAVQQILREGDLVAAAGYIGSAACTAAYVVSTADGGNVAAQDDVLRLSVQIALEAYESTK